MSAFKSVMVAAAVLSVAAASSAAYAEPVRANESVPAAATVNNAPVKKMQVRRTKSPLKKESAAVPSASIPIIAGATVASIAGVVIIASNDSEPVSP